MALETVPFDPAEFLGDDDAQAEFLAEAFETGNASFIANALGAVARARGMSSIARDAGVTREALYRALSEKGDPKLSTLLGVMRGLGIKLTAVPASPAE
jgi:probable addiction module antidote protein